MCSRSKLALLFHTAALLLGSATIGQAQIEREARNLRAAINDLAGTFGARYAGAGALLARLEQLERATDLPADEREREFRKLQREALLANPLLAFDRLLVVKRASRPLKGSAGLWTLDRTLPAAGGNGLNIGMPSNHECNSVLPRDGWDNEIASLSLLNPTAPLRTVYRPPGGGYVGEVDVHWDSRRMLFTQSDGENWKIWECATDGSGLRQVTRLPTDVDAMDACYLPDGKIMFGSTGAHQAVPCWHGLRSVTNLFVMDADGGGVRQVCFDQDHNFHPVVQPDGQVLFHRWDYTGINHVYLRQLMVMNPDGTGQRAVYGASSWFPNSLYFPRALPGAPGQITAILSGYHGVHRMGQMVVIDTKRGWQEGDGIVRISGRGLRLERKLRDNLVDQDWPRFLHPFPLSAKYLVVACLPDPKANWGIYLADIFDNLVLLREEAGYALLEPVPVTAQPTPPILPERIDLARDDADVYLHDVYSGAGLAGVPRGTIKRLRVIAYDFGYPGLAGPDRVGRAGPWEVMRILGTVPVEGDGSAFFRVPARTALALQALDREGKAVQPMRSWFTAQPGERVSCVGCHSRPGDVGAPAPGLAAQRPPRALDEWYGPARGFSFTREVQPVLDRHCVACHDGDTAAPDLRRPEQVGDYRGLELSAMAIKRLASDDAAADDGRQRYAPAYDALIGYLRRVSIEDDVSTLVPGEYHAHTSPLIQLLRKGHGGVDLDAESMDRLVTWIDLNAPCHGTWSEVSPSVHAAHARRLELRRLLGGAPHDPEIVPATTHVAGGPTPPRRSSDLPAAQSPEVPGWPFPADEAQRRQAALGLAQRQIDLGAGLTLTLAPIPAGTFVIGDARGQPDEHPVSPVRIPDAFWMSVHEISNAQYRQFAPGHSPRYYGKRHGHSDDQGLPLDSPEQPVVRVSWEEAVAFCRWLSDRTGETFRLPTEAEWEWACRAGSSAPLSFGSTDIDFSGWANLGDRAFTVGEKTTGGLELLLLEGAALAETRFDDGGTVTVAAGRYRPNAWGLYDMHGNAAEWTLSAYQPYPYSNAADRNAVAIAGANRVVRGGSFFDPPRRARSGFRLDYPPWQRVFNVGFRVVCERREGPPAR